MSKELDALQKLGIETRDPAQGAARPVRVSGEVTVESGTVRITDIDMPFSSMVGFMVKWAIASIPAFLILLMLGAIASAVFTAVMGAIAAAIASGS